MATVQGANRVGLSPIYAFDNPKSPDAELGPASTWMIRENTRFGGDGADEMHPLEWDEASDFNGHDESDA